MKEPMITKMIGEWTDNTGTKFITSFLKSNVGMRLLRAISKEFYMLGFSHGVKPKTLDMPEVHFEKEFTKFYERYSK